MFIVYAILICSLLVDAPKFISHPKLQTVNLMQTALFECRAIGYNVKYRWRSGSRLFSNAVTGINTSTLKIPDVKSSDDNTYTCIITNDGGSIISHPAKLTVTGMTIKYYIFAVW